MSSTNWTRTLALSFLVLMIHALPPTNSSICTAQSQFTRPSLEDTKWKADTIHDPNTDLISLQFVFAFEKQGKVGFRLDSTETQHIMRLVYDPVGRIILPRTFGRTWAFQRD